MSVVMRYERGLREIGDGCYAYLQPNGSWGWNNAGLISDGGASLLVDTLYDVRLTGQMLEAMRAAVPAAKTIGTVVNTHANGDHCWGNQLVRDAEIIASRRGTAEMSEIPPSLMVKLEKIARLSMRLGPLGRGVGWLADKLGIEMLASVVEAAPFVLEIFGPFEFEGIVLVLPFYLLYRNVGLLDSLFGLGVTYLTFALPFATLPRAAAGAAAGFATALAAASLRFAGLASRFATSRCFCASGFFGPFCAFASRATSPVIHVRSAASRPTGTSIVISRPGGKTSVPSSGFMRRNVRTAMPAPFAAASTSISCPAGISSFTNPRGSGA
jgi:hypothetical protein